MKWWIELSEIVRNFGILIAAAVGIFIAWRRAIAANRQADAQFRQAELSRRDHVSELFNRAVGQLADRKLEIRLGAVYTFAPDTKGFS